MAIAHPTRAENGSWFTRALGGVAGEAAASAVRTVARPVALI